MLKFFKMNAVIPNGRTVEKLLINNKTAKYMMNRKDILILHNAGVVRRVSEKKIIHTTDTTIKYVYFLQKGLIKISNIGEDGEEVI